jgi:hypothetical protein
MSYKDLEIWQLAKIVVIEVHHMTIYNLPKYEMYEEGAQIRRSIKSVRSNIVEGYGNYEQTLAYPISDIAYRTSHIPYPVSRIQFHIFSKRVVQNHTMSYIT